MVDIAEPETPQAPAGSGLGLAVRQFFLTIAYVAAARARKYGPAWIAQMSEEIATGFEWSYEQDYLEFDDEREAYAAKILELELNYICYRFRDLVPEDARIIDMTGYDDFYGEVDTNPFSDETIKDINIAKGSIEKILDKSPIWLRKILEAMMEILQLTRGVM